MTGQLVLFLHLVCGLHTVLAYEFLNVTLYWTKSSPGGDISIEGVSGDPSDWVEQTLSSKTVSSTNLGGTGSRRMALGFRYSTKEVFFSDSEQKEMLKLEVETVSESGFKYKSTPTRVYSGTSDLVYGVALDWLSGAIYWTDARYNWVAVAASAQYEVHKYLVTTGLDKPMGVAVDPRNGWLFWSDWGSVPKIERATLDGSNRELILAEDLDRPLGMTIDYEEDHLYWVDDTKDTVERMDLDGRNRMTIAVRDVDSWLHTLFGIAVYKSYIFVTDQFTNSVRVYDKYSKEYMGMFAVGSGSIPYDIMMFDQSLQPRGESECSTLQCQHLCLSLGNGRAKCDCGIGYDLQDDERSCVASESALKPQYLYSIGDSLCFAKIHFPDSPHSASYDIDCSLVNASHVEALAFDSYAELLFYSDTFKQTIVRKRLTGDMDEKVIATHTGNVRGLAVDWLSSHLYWTDEELGHIVVSDLEGRYRDVIVSGLDSPRGIEVDPSNGVMYWSAPGAIHTANLDGTGARVLVDDVSSPDGLVLDPHDNKLYWADRDVQGIGATKLPTAEETYTIKIQNGVSFRDVTIYQDYMVCTDGDNAIYYGLKKGSTQRLIRHPDSHVSHDVITYDNYLQPLSRSLCDATTCDHMCLPTSGSFRCACALGFYLGADGTSCETQADALEGKDFILLVDPYQGQAYQVPLTSGNDTSPVSGVGLQSAEHPTLVEYDVSGKTWYWYDGESRAIKRRAQDGVQEELLAVFSKDQDIAAISLDQFSERLLFTEQQSKSLMGIQLQHMTPGRRRRRDILQQLIIVANIIPAALAVDRRDGHIFWAAIADGKPTIFCLPADGRNRVTLFTYGADFTDDILGLSMDSTDRWLYWWTSGGQISRLRLGAGPGGPGVEHVLQIEPSDSIKVAALGSMLYYVTETSRAVYRKDLSSEDEAVRVTEEVFSTVTDLKLFNVEARPQETTTQLSTTGNPSGGTTTTPQISTTTESQTTTSTAKESLGSSTTESQSTTTSESLSTTATTTTTTTTTTESPTSRQPPTTKSPATTPSTTTSTTRSPSTTTSQTNPVPVGAESSDDDSSSDNTIVLAAAAGGCVLLLCVVIAVVVCLVRRKRKSNTAPPGESDIRGHENPSYMTADEMRAASGLPEAEGRCVSSSDTEKLVEGSEVMITVDSINTRVAYNTGTSNA